MYGLVNKAVKDLVVANFGEQTWLEIAQDAGVDPVFISMDSYDDQITYDLVAAASSKLETPPNEILRQFGFGTSGFSSPNFRSHMGGGSAQHNFNSFFTFDLHKI